MAWRRLLELLLVSGLAIAQPLFDLLGQNPEFLVAHRLHGAALALLALAIAALPPLTLWILERLVHRISERAANVVHFLLLALLLSATALAPLQRTLGDDGGWALVLAAPIGILLAMLLARSVEVARVARWGSVGVLALVALFLAGPQVRGLLFATDAGPSERAVVTSDTPVLLVILDALPLASILNAGGEIDAGEFPHLAALAGDAVWFRNASTNADFTARAVPAILSGRLPDGSPKAHWSEHPNNLFTLLAPSHEILAAESVTALCPPRLDRGSGGGLALLVDDLALVYAHAVLPKPMRRGLPSVSEGWRGFGHGDQGILGQGTLGRRIAHIDAFLDRLREPAATRPTFAFLHAEVPHRPYGLYPSGRFYSSTGREPGGRTDEGKRLDDPQVAVHAWQRHLLQARYADARLGEALDRWRDRGDEYDRSVIVVVSDHGVSFRPGQMARHLTDENRHEVLPVPLLVKFPHGASAGEVRDVNVEAIDILPTIAAAAGIGVDFAVDGQDLARADFVPRPTKRVVLHASERTSEFEPDLTAGAMAIARDRIARAVNQGGIADLPAPLRELLDRPVPADRIGPPSPRPFSIGSPGQVRVEPDARLLPGEAFGFVGAVRHTWADQLVLVAVDGVARALTRPYRPWRGQGDAAWYALLPEASLGTGDHSIWAYLVSGGEEDFVLHPPSGGAVVPSYLDIPLGRISYLGVETTGLLEGKARAAARVEFRVPMRTGERPRSLRATIEALDPESTRLAISVNGSQVFTGILEPGTWRQRVALPALSAGEPVIVSIDGDPARIDPERDWTFGRVEIELER